MGRWQPDAGKRLMRAAFDLFEERGYDNTTVTEIAVRAGLTKRTFFRHFSDKREVLFAGVGHLRDVMVAAVAAAPSSAGPLELIGAALEAAGDFFGEGPDLARRRRRIIAANPELQERELIKLAALAGALAQALRARGIREPTALLTAETGVTVLRVALELWTDEQCEGDLRRLLRTSVDELRSSSGRTGLNYRSPSTGSVAADAGMIGGRGIRSL
jgi:AcrR family transcriptional regulator